MAACGSSKPSFRAGRPDRELPPRPGVRLGDLGRTAYSKTEKKKTQ